MRDRLNMYRRYPYWAAKRCIFVHVPKAAGTSINRAIYGRTLGHFRARDIQRSFPGLYERSFVFGVVRNPWARALSAYSFAVQGRTGTMGIRNPEMYRGPEFTSFERFLKEWLVHQNDLGSLDHVFRLQVDYLTDDEGVLITNYIGKVETIERDILEVGSKLGMVIELGRYNRTASTDDYQSAYENDDMINIVRHVYRTDVEKFGYEFQ